MQSGIDPFAIIWLRLCCGAIFFSVMVLFQPSESVAKFQRSDVITLILCGLFGSILNQVFFYYGLKITNPINASIFNLLNPITIIALSYFLFKEKLSKTTLASAKFHPFVISKWMLIIGLIIVTPFSIQPCFLLIGSL